MALTYPDNHHEGDGTATVTGSGTTSNANPDTNGNGVYEPHYTNTNTNTPGRSNHQEELLKSLCGDDEKEEGGGDERGEGDVHDIMTKNRTRIRIIRIIRIILPCLRMTHRPEPSQSPGHTIFNLIMAI